MITENGPQPQYKARHMLLFFGVIMLVISIVNYVILIRAQTRIFEHEAVRIAEIVTDQAMAARSVFSSKVANKLKTDGFGSSAAYEDSRGFVPLPAQFLKYVGQAVHKGSSGLYSYRPLSKWNLEPTQGLQDEFQYWAWRQLEEQDVENPTGPINWQPVWRFEYVNEIRMLRYMRADPASQESCVNCHNAMEQTPDIIARRVASSIVRGKKWKQHQLLGAIEVSVPVNKIESLASDQARQTLGVMLLSSAIGLGAAAGFAIRDMKRQRVAAEFFEQKAKSDPLTHLGNRAMFMELGNTVLNLAKRNNTQATVLFVDLDRFKPINDTYGHKVGDAVLKEISHRLRSILRESDLIARQGGDEFLILLAAGKGAPNSSIVADKLLAAICKPILIDGIEHKVGASIGISYFPEHGADLTTLIEKADAAMYAAKRQGRGNYKPWTPDMVL